MWHWVQAAMHVVWMQAAMQADEAWQAYDYTGHDGPQAYKFEDEDYD